MTNKSISTIEAESRSMSCQRSKLTKLLLLELMLVSTCAGNSNRIFYRTCHNSQKFSPFTKRTCFITHNTSLTYPISKTTCTSKSTVSTPSSSSLNPSLIQSIRKDGKPKSTITSLCVHHNQNNCSNGSNKNNRKGVLSKTARESAVIVEWEPVSELQRRIEDGIHYEHFTEYEYYNNDGKRKRRGSRSEATSSSSTKSREDTTNVEIANSIFCGFTYSEEEVQRMKSANVKE
mmetsp:Transcript_26953/g.31354  ORF Transcript_26953/g.31354 Transcript_26953/m.31354 type:complete len:233 (-) Transcript_26953:142-840(-)